MLSRRVFVVLWLFAVGLLATAATQGFESAAQTPAPDSIGAKARLLLDGNDNQRSEALAWLVDRGNKDAIPAVIQALRFSRQSDRPLLDALRALAGEDAGPRWFDWMLWQQARADITPFEGFDAFKADVMASIDQNFRVFLYPGIRHDIRLEEITWGGVRKDGIPALINPGMIEANAADYMSEDELVFGIEINGDVRAYPLRIMDWHEMFNDVIGGVPVSLAYCTLCGSGILFETELKSGDMHLVFGSSGFLYRSNKLMYDTETHSLWNQFTGRPVVGTLTGSGIELKTRPVVIPSWKDWRARHPETKILSLDTGHHRDYRPGRPYGEYFASADLMFPALVDETRIGAKDYVFALRSSGAEKAWPLSRFDAEPVINDNAGVVQLTLVGDSATRTVRAYRTDGQAFSPGGIAGELVSGGKTWKITEQALLGPAGERLTRLPGHIAYWFAWSGYLGGDGELATATN
jgi:hypothetical protein